MAILRTRRTQRDRFWHMGILFLIYTCLSVYSASIGETENTSENNENILGTEMTTDKESFTTAPSEKDKSTENETLTTSAPPHPHATWRPLRVNCTPPAIEQFPQPVLGPKIRKHGGLIIHVFVAIFTFLGLAIVCDDYFVSSLDRICEELKLSPDVAGATFMAAGSSAPELATVIIGVFFAKDDIGISGVIGSAVFNIMFVISVCALCAGTVCQLNWYPLVRDCIFYSISILVMLIVIINDVISWVEALVMMLFYVGYCIALIFNSQLEKWALATLPNLLPINLPSKDEQSSLVTFKNLPDTSYTQEQTNLPEQEQSDQQSVPQEQNNDPNASWDPNAAWGEQSSGPATAVVPANTWSEGQQNHGYNATGEWGDWNEQTEQETKINEQSAQQQTGSGIVGKVQPEQQPTNYYKPKEQKAEDIVNPLEKPNGLPAQISWAIMYPIHYMCRLTIPDCKSEKYRNWYAFTFLMSMVWISFYSYFMVWMITVIGSTLGIPDTVMGLTFVAAGVSVPDALSSISVIREGYGDMAVSNAVGSNVFDILICLGLPWFIQTAIIKPGSHVNVISKGLIYSTLSLVSTVVFLLLAIHMNGWKLDKKLGIVLMAWYLLFITLASLYELNVFGDLNPPECPSLY